MNKLLLSTMIAMIFLLTSCYTYQMNVGEGSQTGVEVVEKNHYLIYGLIPLSQSDPAKMADGASDYSVTIVHTFIDGLLNAITGGIYTPTTTVVKK